MSKPECRACGVRGTLACAAGALTEGRRSARLGGRSHEGATVSALDYILSRSLPFVPRPIVRRVSRPYIPAETLQDAAGVVRPPNAGGGRGALDELAGDWTR